LRHPSGSKEYLAFNHPEGNNASFELTRRKLADACRGTVVCHNASFDLDIMDTFFSLRPVNFEDTLFLAFLSDPRREMGLKPLSHELLGMPPDEQTEMNDWILNNVKGAKRSKTRLGNFIGECPGNIVAPYAIGDVDRTFRLLKLLKKEITRRGMDEAYQREKKLMWVTLEMERSGVRVDVLKLKAAQLAFEKLVNMLIKNIHKRLGVGGDFNINSPAQLGAALMAADKLDAVMKTKTGKISTKITNLEKTCNDKMLLKMMAVHSVAEKYLNTFIRPWLEKAEVSGGRILPTFNQVRGRDDRGGGGTRTGRYSSSNPNLQQVASNVEDSKNAATLQILQKWLKEYCDLDFIGLRDFILPDEGMLLCAVDYDQQELRLLGHFENDVMCQAYADNPKMDGHDLVRELVRKALGVDYGRKAIKTINFGIIYGMGLDKLALQLGIDRDEAQDIRNGVFSAIPGIKKLMRQMSDYEDMGKPFRTWGGREYYTEEPKMVNHRMQHYGYKNMNTVIQGSAADVTKQGMINVAQELERCRIAIQVHDELITMIPSSDYAPKVAAAMCDLMGLRVPMSATPKLSAESWARAA